MKNETIDSLQKKSRMSHNVLFWCTNEIEKKEKSLFEELCKEAPEEEKVKEIQLSLKYLYYKSGFEKSEVMRLRGLSSLINFKKGNL